MRTIDWYFDFISPYAYLQCARLPALPSDVEVRCKPVLLSALLDHVGTLGPAEVPGRREFMYRQISWLAHRNAVPLKLPPQHPFNPLSALRLAVAGGASRELVCRIFDFVWADGRDPSDPAEFAALADALGIPEATARISDPATKARLKTNTDEAIAAGVWGVPTFVVDGLCFWGFDSGEMLVDYLANPSLFLTAEHARAAGLPGIVRRRKL